MKKRKALKKLEERIRAWEETMRTFKGNPKAFPKPGSMSGRK